MALCSGILKPSYFDTELRKVVKFSLDYFEKYRDVPKLQIIRAETGAVLEDAGKIEKSDIAYVAKETEEFCRNKAVAEAILAGPELLSKGDFGKIIDTLKEAISVGLAKDSGTDYFKDPEERIRRQHGEEGARISTGWIGLDDALGGGLGRQELLLFAGVSGSGKSVSKLNLARNLLYQGLNGVYITLEMAENVVSRRLDSMISRVAHDALLKEAAKVSIAVQRASEKAGQFFIKRMPENRTNINHVRSYITTLEQQHGFHPDFIVIDYVDIMGSTNRISLDNIFLKDKYVVEEIRSLGFDYNCIMISSSQLGRHAEELDKVTQSNIQGGMSKVNTSDYIVAIKQDDAMRANGEIWYDILKSRNSNGRGKRILLGWDPVSLLITSLTGKLEFKKKPTISPSSGGTVFAAPATNDLLNLMNT